MKFLCVACDEPMKLNRTLGPDEGSMTIVYRCPSCERETAMLTNSMETQMVRALDISIGGRSAPKRPMAFVKSSLAGTSLADEALSAESEDSSTAHPTSASKCPFSSTINEAYATATTPDAATEPAQTEPVASEPECPFPHGTITWAAEATARVERIPSYIRPMVIKGVEEFAKSAGLTTIDSELMESLKERFGGM